MLSASEISLIKISFHKSPSFFSCLSLYRQSSTVLFKSRYRNQNGQINSYLTPQYVSLATVSVYSCPTVVSSFILR